MTHFSALVSDLDGTLMDSEPVHCAAWLSVLAEHGLQFDTAWFEQWIGTSDRYLAKHIVERHTLSGVTVRDLQLAKQQRYHRQIASEGQTFEGIPEVIARIAGRFPMAIATNSSRSDADHAFQATRIDRFARAVITADDVAQLKPAPDIYLRAAELLEIDPRHCIAVEDSPAGSQAAKSAGMYVLGLVHTQPREKMMAADELFTYPVDAFRRVEALLQIQLSVS
jgi:HAD superfamily hydrolase (TIGR01509 family)